MAQNSDRMSQNDFFFIKNKAENGKKKSKRYRMTQNGREWHRIGTKWHKMIYVDKNKSQNSIE